jgi:hypothetical protein
MFLVSLCSSSMRLGIPFIAPRQLRAVEDQQGRLSLPSVECRDDNGDPIPDSPRGIHPLGDGDGEETSPTGI